MRINQLKQKLQQGETAIGTFITCADPALVEICGLAGFDLAAIDLEHSPLDPLTAENLCRAADCTGLSPVIRVRKNDGAGTGITDRMNQESLVVYKSKEKRASITSIESSPCPILT